MQSLNNSDYQNSGVTQNHASAAISSLENFSPDADTATSEQSALMEKMRDACTSSSESKAEEFDVLSHQVLPMIMHDIKSPLSTIQLCLEIVSALSNFTDEDDPVLRALSRAQANIERVQRLVADVLIQEKIKSGTIELNVRPISLEAVINESIDSLAAIRHVQNVEISVADVGTTVFADRIRLSQILQNLLCNAISFSPPGSSVWVKGSKLHLDRGEYSLISVEDRGPGIPESIRSEIFGAYRQAPSGMHRCGSYGLGLAICERLVSLHGGKIWVEANAGRGCTFHVALPCR